MRFLFALFIATATSAAAQDMTSAERDAFRDEVRAYLMENPEVIMEAIEVLQAREEAASAQADAGLIATYADALYEDPSSFVDGNPEGDITIVEFLDYRCGYCRRAHPEIAELISSDGNIRLIVKEFPILGEGSVVASQFAIAVKQMAGDEAYKIVNDTLMTLKSEPSQEVLAGLANEIGLASEDVFEAMQSAEVNDVIRRNRELGQAMQINGTPTFIIENQMLRGYLPLEQMEQVVAAARG